LVWLNIFWGETLHKYEKWKWQKEYFGGKSQNFEKKFDFLLYFYLDFQVREFFLPIFYIFGHVYKHICRHLMLNPSWDACIWCNIKHLKNLKKRKRLINYKSPCFQLDKGVNLKICTNWGNMHEKIGEYFQVMNAKAKWR